MKANIQPIGSAALGIYFEPLISEAINDAVIALMCDIQAEGIVEMVPSYAALTVFYDPLVTDFFALKETIEGCLRALENQPNPSKEVIDVPVIYGGADGPDLLEVSEHTGLSVEAIIEKHTAPLYRIYMLGFTPGFPYLGGMDPALNTPRKASPRLRIMAGSVGIAGNQTGIYPIASPGGWQIIGRTLLNLFDPSSKAPFLFKAGQYIRFYPVKGGAQNGF